MRELRHLDVVIAPSWTDAFSLDNIRGRFSADIALRVIGKTRAFPHPGVRTSGTVGAYLISKKLETEEWVAIEPHLLLRLAVRLQNPRCGGALRRRRGGPAVSTRRARSGSLGNRK